MQKFEERQKNFMNSDINLTRSREERSLTLRKNQLLKDVLFKRSSEFKYKRRKFTPIIELNQIDLPQDVKDHFENSPNQFEKIVQWISSTENESYEQYIKEFDPTNVQFSLNSKLRLFALEKLRILSEELQLGEEEEFEFDKNLFQILISILKDHENIYLKFEILEIFQNFCSKSPLICEMFLDIDYASIIYNLLNSSDFMFVEKSLYLIGNIIVSSKEGFDYVMTHFPLEIKLKEMLQSGIYDEDTFIFSNLLWVLRAIIKETNEESFETFADIIPKIADHLRKKFKHQDREILYFLVSIVFNLSKSYNMKVIMTSNNIPGYILNIIEDAEIMYDNLKNLIITIDQYIESDNYFLDYLIEKRIIDIYTKKLNECINIPNNSAIKQKLQSLLFAISNIAAGTPFQVRKLICSDILLPIHNIFKISKCNDILIEIIIIFTNMLIVIGSDEKLNQELFFTVLKYEPLRIFSDGIRGTNKESLILESLRGIFHFIINYPIIPKDKLQEVEIEIDSVTPLINNLIFSKNEQVAGNAKALLGKCLEFKNFKKNCNVNFMDCEMINVDN